MVEFQNLIEARFKRQFNRDIFPIFWKFDYSSLKNLKLAILVSSQSTSGLHQESKCNLFDGFANYFGSFWPTWYMTNLVCDQLKWDSTKNRSFHIAFRWIDYFKRSFYRSARFHKFKTSFRIGWHIRNYHKFLWKIWNPDLSRFPSFVFEQII